MDTVNNGENPVAKYSEVVWCNHVDLSAMWLDRGISRVQIKDMTVDIYFGQGKVRICCKECSPRLYGALLMGC